VNATQKSTVSSSYVVLPYIKGVTERITRTLQREKFRVSFQPTRTLQQEFPKPKDKLDTNLTRDIVYKIECSPCDFTYYMVKPTEH
jgi:hypothetical protein